MEDFQVPKSILKTVPCVLAAEAQNVLQIEGPVGSDSSTRVWGFIDLEDF